MTTIVINPHNAAHDLRIELRGIMMTTINKFVINAHTRMDRNNKLIATIEIVATNSYGIDLHAINGLIRERELSFKSFEV